MSSKPSKLLLTRTRSPPSSLFENEFPFGSPTHIPLHDANTSGFFGSSFPFDQPMKAEDCQLILAKRTH